MIIGTFIFYFVLFIIIFSYPGLKQKDNCHSKSVLKLLAIPALLGLGMVFLTVIKVYFIYKIFALLALLVIFVLTYWQWGTQISRWWK
ncbi:hypothetical protein [Desulfosporosinus meridiei]|uniref:Uncharacterized protein n=1 Tax=Desulfosporosinus meridiei (strain ATCC BAA-275 / DSM 13257 / KCTC 12902 / NCIMB 13706 / S10) TaxID=768704 RepID=J7IZL7_DESMD|nr:hypothetical protein [Desulfosporosinus meridiei]AFQ44513.1 hypothetical protein Desmer_2599 [Desulfosporosinus meridiei DSM 13257]